MTSVSEAARQIRQEEASRTQLYQRLAPIVGAFDAGEMSAAEIAAYGLKKLNLTVPSDDGSKVAAINCWLAGRDLATNPDAGRRGAMDSGGNSIVDRYIRGEA